ncbi:DEDD exonuclease domain-containing protein [Salisaeta longa]|uniref:DEDD exonuclease domain-containing protein n=1 Tax=Salisaeta longa TaxID=503170 RepID=UPI0006851961|nr:DEDD exonuclease domain-containing protein [Salisaeta longa]
MPLADTTFVVTDTETTGTKTPTDRIIEIGAVKLRGSTIVDRFQQLINPQRSIPRRITRLTGISTGMVVDAPPMDDVLPDFLDFLGDGVFVAHNLPFDERFVNAACSRLGYDPLANEGLCTLRLARRLLPGLRKRGLSRLIDFYGITINGRHRALGDAEATAVVLQRFLSQLAFEHEVDTTKELLAFQHRSYKTVRSAPKHLERLRTEVLPDVPDAPGVYRMTRANGEVLYIGKAKRLARRVRSYFTGIESHTPRRRKLMKHMRRLEWTPTDTELEALLLESRLIKRHKPRYNRAQRRYRSRPFLRLSTEEAFPRLGWERTLHDDAAEYYGPLRNVEQAERIIERIGQQHRLRTCDNDTLRLGQRCLYADMDRCTAPCENDDETRYAHAVANVQAVLTGRDRSILDHLQQRMAQASEQLAFEQAAAFRDDHALFERFLDRQAALQAPVRQQHAVVLYRPPHAEGHTLLLIRHGRFVASLTGVSNNGSSMQRLTRALTPHFAPDVEAPAGLSKRAVDEMRLLAHWLYGHREAIHVVRWNASAPGAFAGRVLDALDAA